MKTSTACILGFVAAVLFSQATASAAAVNSLESKFDNSGLNPSNVQGLNLDNIVGIGTMTYTGAPLVDGAYDFTSFQNLTLSFSFNGDINFTGADMTTDPGAVDLKIVISGSTFEFAAPPNGLSNGSAEFINGTSAFFAVSPIGYPFYAYYVGPTAQGAPTYSGVYGSVNVSAIPEPSTYAALMGVVALGAVVVRRRRTAFAKV